jgi:hypothetical protein
MPKIDCNVNQNNSTEGYICVGSRVFTVEQEQVRSFLCGRSLYDFVIV